MGEAKRRRLALDGPNQLTEEQIRVGCELALLFMLWHVPRGDEEKGTWFHICSTEFVKYPWGSYRSVWWWSMRHLGDIEEGKTLEQELADFRSYFAWKLDQYETTLKSQREARW